MLSCRQALNFLSRIFSKFDKQQLTSSYYLVYLYISSPSYTQDLQKLYKVEPSMKS